MNHTKRCFDKPFGCGEEYRPVPAEAWTQEERDNLPEIDGYVLECSAQCGWNRSHHDDDTDCWCYK